MINPISITAISSISALGDNHQDIWEEYKHSSHKLSFKKFENTSAFVGAISKDIEFQISQLKTANKHYKDLDKSVLMAIIAARTAFKKSGWKTDDFGINIGSSRGATSLFEHYHQQYLESKQTDTLASPTTTLGNISTWVANDLQSKGPTISHSITCSTALHAILNGVAWINAGMSTQFLAGGSEAPLTPFTIAQMQALKIYSNAQANENYPCKTLDFSKKKNTMVLGEGTCIAALEKGQSKNALAIITGIGYATEVLEHNISISNNADCFQASMKMALSETKPDEIDAIVMHAPGTMKGDSSEYNAIQKVFCKNVPALTSNKWKIGHTFGASGALSLELAILMLQNQYFIHIPFIAPQKAPSQLNKILVNAVGFGGNAVSILLTKPN